MKYRVFLNAVHFLANISSVGLLFVLIQRSCVTCVEKFCFVLCNPQT